MIDMQNILQASMLSAVLQFSEIQFWCSAVAGTVCIESDLKITV